MRERIRGRYENLKHLANNGTAVMDSFWKRIPDQIKRLLVPVILLLAALFAARIFLVPADFGKYGHYRASAVDSIAALPIRYAAQETCTQCHDEIMTKRLGGYHRNVACEACHGPGAVHAENPEAGQLMMPQDRGYCPLCHEYLPSRPTGFPQVVSQAHNPRKPCISCHDPHDPEPPSTPKQCDACHAEVARTKDLSHHVYVPCTRCHETPEEHLVEPRANRPKKPLDREFCGGCHAEDAAGEKGTSRVDLETHEPRYVCWQCHYPHMPEAR